MGKEVAEKVAEWLGYERIAREVLVEASEQFNIPEIKLLRTIQDTPSILERSAMEGRNTSPTYSPRCCATSRKTMWCGTAL
jgi:hypothetical protein